MSEPTHRPIPLQQQTFVPREEVLSTFESTPVTDAERFRADADAAISQDPFDRDW